MLLQGPAPTPVPFQWVGVAEDWPVSALLPVPRVRTARDRLAFVTAFFTGHLMCFASTVGLSP